MGGALVELIGNGFDPLDRIKVEMGVGNANKTDFLSIEGDCKVEKYTNSRISIRTPGTYKTE